MFSCKYFWISISFDFLRMTFLIRYHRPLLWKRIFVWTYIVHTRVWVFWLYSISLKNATKGDIFYNANHHIFQMLNGKVWVQANLILGVFDSPKNVVLNRTNNWYKLTRVVLSNWYKIEGGYIIPIKYPDTLLYRF